MSEKEEGSLSHSENGSIDGSLKGSGSPAESGRLTRSRSASPASRKSGASAGSRHSPASPRSRSRSRSFRRGVYRSRSRSRSRGRKYYYSRSRSRSPHYGHRRRSRYERRRGYYRSRSRSPMSRRRRHTGNRDNPKEGRCVGVFGLSLYTQERDLREVFSRYGPLEDVQVVYDHQTGRSRGFAFVYFRSTDDALEAKERATGTEIDGRRIRVDFSITERAHTPTPGIYLGKPTPGYRSGGGGGGYGRRSPSPYYRRPGRYSRSRSRSRSYTPPSRRY